MVSQVISKTTKLYDLTFEDYTKYPGNGDLNKKIVKCALYAHIKTGINRNVENFIKFLFEINTHTFFNYESLTTIFEYIIKEEKNQDEILDFLSTFLVELTMNNLKIDYLKSIIADSLKEFALHGVGRINDKLKDYLDNNHILVNNDFDCLTTLLFLIKIESFNILYVLTEK